MAFTITPAPATGATITTRLRHVDNWGEPIVKNFQLYNSEGRYQLAMRAYEGLSQAAIPSGSATQKFALSGMNTTPTGLTPYPKAGDFCLLAFQREHPVASMAGTYIQAEFLIIAPHPDIFDVDTLKPYFVGGETFETAATRPEALGALIAWLEDALTVTVLKVQYSGGWTYDADNSAFGGLDKQYDKA